MTGLLIPKTYIPEEKINSPIIFLAGPIRQAPNWQDEATRIILDKNPNILVISPRRGIRKEIEKCVIKGEEDHFHRQRAWERYYLELASRKGVVMFWLPKPQEHSCEKPYASLTRVEIGQIMTKYALDKKTKFCVGGEEGFYELELISYDLGIDAPDKKVFSTLNETINEAIRILSQ